MVDYYNDEEELDSMEDDDDRSFRGRESEEGNVYRFDWKLTDRWALSSSWERNGNAPITN